ncbi:MAG: hypothetical protein K9L69_02000 [Candidatus Omnitrophica bacterium]|nr:hypothetical protein [Candidatus Omnitrophota bacterium]MCF7894893.1 hypothetical protein [Candidatus Omnitrophota bacterium]
MIKSLKFKVQSPKSIKNIALLFVMVLFLVGCVTTQEYIGKNKGKSLPAGKAGIKEKVEDKKNIVQDFERKEEWIGSYLGENDFIKQCPVCKRRYQGFLKKCPYDGAELEKIKEEIK